MLKIIVIKLGQRIPFFVGLQSDKYFYRHRMDFVLRQNKPLKIEQGKETWCWGLTRRQCGEEALV